MCATEDALWFVTILNVGNYFVDEMLRNQITNTTAHVDDFTRFFCGCYILYYISELGDKES